MYYHILKKNIIIADGLKISISKCFINEELIIGASKKLYLNSYIVSLSLIISYDNARSIFSFFFMRVT